MPFGAGPHLRVGAGLGLPDVGVAGFDGGEHGPDVAGAQPVQGQLAQVRDEVDPYVRLVAAAGGLLHVDAGHPLGEVRRDGGRRGQRHLGPQALPDGVHVGRRLPGLHGGLDQVGDLGGAAPVPAGQGEQGPGLVEPAGGVALAGVAAAA